MTAVDPQTGKQIKTPSKKWWCRYRDALGIERRQPLVADKRSVQALLNKILQKVEQEKAGLIDPTEAEMKKPISIHIEDYERHLKAKNNDPRYVTEIVGKLRRCVKHCKWRRNSQIKVTDVENFLYHLREEDGLAIQTSNHYLKAIKAFVRWMVRNQRLKSNPVDGLSGLNAQLDRRPMSMDEFTRLLQAAETGPPAVGLVGPDRAMLYLLAAWTGFRRGELGSLTLKNFIGLDSEMPIIHLQATYSKRRRNDEQMLHPDIAARLRKWLEFRRPGSDTEILFLVSKKTCGVDRRTSEMMAYDLKAARLAWLAEATSESEREQWATSDYLKYVDSNGHFADFHSLRHTFITNLSRANVPPKVAQALARHSDIRLTMNIYSHASREDQAKAINALPGLPPKK